MLFIPFFILISFAFAQSCPDLSSAPLCPESGSTLLDDTYPASAFVISTKGTDPTKTHSPLPAKFVTNIMLSYKKNHPEILVPTSEEALEKLKLEVAKNLQEAKVPQTQIEDQLKKIKKVDAPAYTWQQDFFESFVNLETGRPDLRSVASYDNNLLFTDSFTSANYTSAIATALSCGTDGAPLKGNYASPRKELAEDLSWGDGEMGGNIEGFPGGLCLKGNNQSKDFVSQYCGSEDNFVEIDVGWLEVGHTDEVIKVIPTFPKTSPAECNFSIMVASPDMGLETLKDPAYANRSFIEASDLDQRLDSMLETKNGIYSRPADVICSTLKNNYTPSKKDSKQGGATQAFLKIIGQFDLNAHAGIIPQSTSSFECRSSLKEVTNRKMLEYLSADADFMDTNKLVQEKMNKAKTDMAKKLKERLPQCKDISFIDVPNLFYNKHNIFAEISGKKELPQPGLVGSLFPNPTNSVVANETLIISEAPNFSFNDKISKLIKKSGLKPSFVDTWNYAHIGNGNLHCSSHTIPYCRPRGKK